MHSHCTHPVLYFASLFLLKSASREAVEKFFCVVNDFVDNSQISRMYSTNFLKQLNLFMLGLGRVFFTRKQKGVEILVSMLLTGSIEWHVIWFLFFNSLKFIRFYTQIVHMFLNTITEYNKIQSLKLITLYPLKTSFKCRHYCPAGRNINSPHWL